MDRQEMALLAKELAPPLQRLVDARVRPLEARLAALEARAPERGIGVASALKDSEGVLILTLSDGSTLSTGIRDGRDAAPVDVEKLVDAVAAKLPEQPKATDSVASETTLESLVEAAVDRALSDRLPPADTILDIVRSEVAKVPVPPAGKDYDPDVLRDAVATEVAKLPPPEPGKSVGIDDVIPVLNDMVAKAVAGLPRLVEAMINREGQLVVVRNDGALAILGPVVGRDVDMAAVREQVSTVLGEALQSAQAEIAAAVAAIPVPKDGVDGLGFEDLALVVDERGAFLQFKRGDESKEFRLPIVIDRGVWKEGASYGAGDGVTWGGSFFIAQRDTIAKPETKEAGSDWRVAVKRGRDGSSAYEIARKNGFGGSESDWLATLRAPPPPPPVRIGK